MPLRYLKNSHPSHCALYKKYADIGQYIIQNYQRDALNIIYSSNIITLLYIKLHGYTVRQMT